jgi:hypothetical protein
VPLRGNWKDEKKHTQSSSFKRLVKKLSGCLIATDETFEACRVDLIEVIEEWIAIRLQRGLDIPALDGNAISVSQEPMAVV